MTWFMLDTSNTATDVHCITMNFMPASFSSLRRSRERLQATHSHHDTVHDGDRRRWRAKVIATCVLVLVALAVRWEALTVHDLYSDEALQTTLSRSLLDEGRLNNFAYSRFTPDSQFRNGMWVYYPPGFYLIQALFIFGNPASHVAARLPVLILNLIGLACLPLLAKGVWNKETPGWIAGLLGALGVFHISMSVTSLPYTLVAPLLVMAFIALVRAVEYRQSSYWAAVVILVVLGFYIMPIALAFCVLLAATVAWGIHHRRDDVTRSALRCIILVVVLCAPWFIWTHGTTGSVSNFLSKAPTYALIGQARLVLQQYDLMLPSMISKLAFLIGFAAICRRAGRKDGLAAALLALWALAPCGYMLSRNMWVTPRHVFCAYIPIILVTAHGLMVAASALVVSIPRGRLGRALGDASALAIAGTIIIAGTQYLSVRAASGSVQSDEQIMWLWRGDAATEFGAPDIVSRASMYIRKHGRGEPVIAPVGLVEAHYLGSFVQDKRTAEAKSLAWGLARSGPTWVFMGDNYLNSGELDEFDRTVQRQGRLIIHSAPVPGLTAPSNPRGYALYYLERPFPPSD